MAKPNARLLLPLILALFPALAFSQVKVNALPSGSTPVAGDYAICDQSGVTNKCTYSQVATSVSNLLTLGTFATQNYATPPAIGSMTPAAGNFTTGGFNSTFTLGGITGSAQCLHVNTSGIVSGTGSDCGSGGSTAFSALTGGTNTMAAMLLGTGASLGATGSGTVTATAAPLAGITGFGTGVATFLATPTSANLATALTDETGTGAAVFGTSPTFTTGATLGFITGSTQCLHVNTSGLISGTGSDCGSGGSTAFSALTSGSNSTAAMVLSSGATLEAGPSTFLQQGSSTGYTAFASANAGATNYTVTFPANTGIVDELNLAQTFTAAKTFTNSDLLILGSSTGATTITSANASATAYTATLPAATDTIAEIAATQTLTNKSIAASEVNSGTLAAAQMPAFTGDVTTSSGAVATTIAAGAVTLAKQANFAASSLMGNPTGSSAAPSAITLGSGLSFSGTTLVASGGSATSITPGTTTVVGTTAPCFIDNSTSTTMGCAALSATLALNSGVLGTTLPFRTVTSSPTVASTDMGGVIYSNVSGGGTVTIPAISSTVFPSGTTLTVVNYSASTAAISTTPTINAGGGCVTATGIPTGDTWEISSNGTTLDCSQSISSGSGSGTVTTTGSPASSYLAGFSGTTSITGTANATLTAGALTLGVSGTAGSVKMGNATSGTLQLQPATGALGTVTVSIPAATDTLVNLAGTQSLSNKSFVAPALGTPASGTLTNALGLPVGGIAAIGANTVVANVTGSSAIPTAAATVTYLVDAGTKMSGVTGTGGCSSPTVSHGGQTAVQISCSGTTGASTIVLSLPSATGITGWACAPSDQTTAADTLHQSANSATSATISGTINTGDVVVVGCIGFGN